MLKLEDITENIVEHAMAMIMVLLILFTIITVGIGLFNLVQVMLT